MFRVTLKSIWSRKGRLLLTAMAIIAGSAFLSGVFIFSDTLRTSFDNLFRTAFENTDAYVRSNQKVDLDFGNEIRAHIPDTLVDEVRAIPGVVDAVPNITAFARISTMDGDALGDDGGAPTFGAVWDDTPLSSWDLAEGRAPTGPDEVVIDRGSAKEGHLSVGDQVQVSATGPARTFTVVGIATFAGKDSSSTTTWALFDLATAEDFVIDAPGMIDGVSVACDGCSEEAFASTIQAALDQPDVEVLTGKEITAENRDSVEGFLTFFSTILTIFALISLFVGSFIIYNVFSISAAQRQRENALFRAIGASRSQVTRSLLIEAIAVGVGGSILGFAGGFGLASAILPVLGGDSDISLDVRPSAFLITLAVGVVVTLLCAIAPAIRSGRVPPLAAMRDVAVDRSDVSRKRLIIGAIFSVVAAVGIVLGLTSDAVWLGAGVVGLFVSLVVLGPLFAGPVARIITAPLGKLRGVTGEIAGRNAARSPKRTALTAAALGIGLALIISVSTMAASVKSSVRESIGRTFLGNFNISYDGGQGFGGLSPQLAADVAALPEVEGAVGMNFVNALTLGDDTGSSGVVAVDAQQAAKTLNLDFESGGWEALTKDGIVLSVDEAKDRVVQVGSTIDGAILGTPKTLTVQGIFDADDLGSMYVDQSTFEGTALPVYDQFVLIRTKPGVSNDAAEAAINQVAAAYPLGKVNTREEFIDKQSKSIDQVLVIIYGLLAMSIFIAVLGIAITLSLAVYERRRELGLMRAVGMTRGQVRGSVRWESMITAFLGALMGLSLGLALGWIVVKALEDQGLNTFTLPVYTIVGATVVAVGFGLVAGLRPASKAAGANILEAIATT